MKHQKQDVIVYYNFSNGLNSELGYITQDQAQSLIKQITTLITDGYPSRCLDRIDIEYSHSVSVHPKDTDFAPTECKKLTLSGIYLDYPKPCWCTRKAWPTQEQAEFNCLKNMIYGECKCPVMGKIGAVLMPTLYKNQSKER